MTNNDDVLEPYFFEEQLFGGKVGFLFFDTTQEAIELIRPFLLIEANRLQKIFNFYDEKSELSILNKKRELEVSSELLEVLNCALKYAELTNGEYDISQGKNILARKKGEKVIEVNCTYKDIRIENKLVSLKNKDVLVDLGSIAKGYIADKLAEFLEEHGVNSALIDARGDIVIFGDHQETLDIAHPRGENNDKIAENKNKHEKEKKIICELKLSNEAVATSGDYKQYIGDYKHSHILNQKELISVTVVAKSLMLADALTSAIFVTDGKLRQKIINYAVNNDCRILTVDDKLVVNKYNWK